MADWNNAQEDPTADDFGKPQPVEPPVFAPYTKDDLRPFTLTVPQAEAQMADLGKAALSEWKEAIALTSTPAERAHAEYVQGWGIMLLSDYREGDAFTEFGGSGLNIPSLPQKDDAVGSFTAATKDDPGNAIYWQSLGDALGPPSSEYQELPEQRAGYGTPHGLGPPIGDNQNHQNESSAAYRHALKLSPKNAVLWYYIAQFEVKATDKSQGEADLRRAIDADPTNSHPMYLLAAAQMHQSGYNNNMANDPEAHTEPDYWKNYTITMAASLSDSDKKLADDALLLVERGNAAPFYFYPVYHPPVPAPLCVAYDYMYRISFMFPAYSEMRNLTRDITAGYAESAAIRGDMDSAMHADDDAIAMGKRLIGDWSMTEDWKSGHTLIGELVGIAVAYIAYKHEARIAKLYGDPVLAQQAQDALDSFAQQSESYKADLRAADAPDQNMYANY